MNHKSPLQNRAWLYRRHLGDTAMVKSILERLIKDGLVAETVGKQMMEELLLAPTRAKFSYELDKEKILKQAHTHKVEDKS